ncbi:hypothetical protein [Streptomyces cyaneofuscatus]|uniref:hypothetical protein n=1 Tax=Streptomyces cyaneofuscatus TaxID=66883 RepID=UPI00339DBA3B
MAIYPNPHRALRHLKRGRAAYLYGRFPQRHLLGMPCCDPGLMTQGREHSDPCLANLERLRGTIVQAFGRIQMAYEDRSHPQRPYPTHART